MKDISLQDLSPESKSELLKQLQEEKKAAREKRRGEIDAYKDAVAEAVENMFPHLMEQSGRLAALKGDVYKAFEAAKSMKRDIYGTKSDGQFSDTYTNRAGDKRITIGTYMLDNYDDTANDGVAMVNDYLDEVAATSPDASHIVSICRSLMSRDKKGTLKPARIATLRKHALESGSKKFIDGVDIIMAAYRPLESKKYVRAEYKDGNGVWRNVPLGMTEAD